MTDRQVVVVAVAVAAVTAGALGAGVAVGSTGSGPSGLGGLIGSAPDSPALLEFESASPECPEEFAANDTSSVAAGDGRTDVTYARNLSLASPSHVVADATFDRVNGSTYALNVRTESDEDVSRTCSGVVRYDGTVRIPVDDGPWRLVVEHDGEPVTTLHGESKSSLLGGSVQVGQRVSGSEGGANDANATA